jgi:DNA-binding GntR family transcriptional regulator
MDESELIERGESLATLVTDRLRSEILGGALENGTRIIQGELAARLGTSRMPIRVAMERLQAEGLLVPDGTGMRVVGVEMDDIQDGYELNRVVTSMAARRAASKITKDELEKLADLHEQLCRAAELGEFERVGRLNWRFHSVINRSARSVRLESMLRFASSMIPHVAFEVLQDWPAQAIADHAALIGALGARDGDGAAAIMAKHVDVGAQAVVDVIGYRLNTPQSGSIAR